MCIYIYYGFGPWSKFDEWEINQKITWKQANSVSINTVKTCQNKRPFSQLHSARLAARPCRDVSGIWCRGTWRTTSQIIHSNRLGTSAWRSTAKVRRTSLELFTKEFQGRLVKANYRPSCQQVMQLPGVRNAKRALWRSFPGSIQPDCRLSACPSSSFLQNHALLPQPLFQPYLYCGDAV